MSNRTLRVLHTSDVHVGETRYSSSAPGGCLLAFRAIVDRALAERVDLVLIAGDLFDNNRVKTDVSDLLLAELARLPMPTVILPGNHDPLDRDSPYRRMSLDDQAPATRLVRDPDGETVHLPELGIDVWGKPHMSYEDDLQPLQGLPDRGAEPWQIVIAHGHLVRSPADHHRSYLITPEEIKTSDRDYVALGHWDLHHEASQGDVTAFYSGSPTHTKLSSLVELGWANGTRKVVVTPFDVTP